MPMCGVCKCVSSCLCGACIVRSWSTLRLCSPLVLSSYGRSRHCRCDSCCSLLSATPTGFLGQNRRSCCKSSCICFTSNCSTFVNPLFTNAIHPSPFLGAEHQFQLQCNLPVEGPDKHSKQVQLKQYTSVNGMRHAMRHEALVMTAQVLHMGCVQML